MSTLDKIKEEVFKVHANPELADYFFHDLLAVEGDRDSYADCIYIDHGERKELILGALVDSLDDIPTGHFDDFREYLRELDPKSLMGFTYAIDSFRLRSRDFDRGRPIPTHDLIEPKFRRIPMLDDILEGSRGWLVWHHQLEWMLRVFCDDIDKSIRFRKDINKALADAFRFAESFEFEKGYTLSDAIFDRRIWGFATLYPSIKEASSLFRISTAQESQH
jgi:hypothetical protein